MEKPFFENVGGEMKAYAEAMARSIQIRYALLAAMTVALSFLLNEMLRDGIVILIGILAAVCIFWHGYQKSKVTVMQFYALGELVERVAMIDDRLRKKFPLPKTKSQRKPEREQEPETEFKVTRNPDGSWDCPFCDHHNPAGADWCEKCDIAAEFE